MLYKDQNRTVQNCNLDLKRMIGLPVKSAAAAANFCFLPRAQHRRRLKTQLSALALNSCRIRSILLCCSCAVPQAASKKPALQLPLPAFLKVGGCSVLFLNCSFSSRNPVAPKGAPCRTTLNYCFLVDFFCHPCTRLHIRAVLAQAIRARSETDREWRPPACCPQLTGARVWCATMAAAW